MGNKFTITLFTITFVLLLAAGIAFALLHTNASEVDAESTIIIMTPGGAHHFRVTLADTDQERAAGLMWVKKMKNESGMLFIFEEDRIQTFWMKNTKIPLDMIFIDSQGTIVSIQKNVQPCTSDPCQSYPSTSPVRYVLEINGGLADEKNINVKDQVQIES